MEGAILSSPSNGRFRNHLKNAASAFCTRTLPKQRRTESIIVAAATRNHHTYPRVAPTKRASISARLEPVLRDLTAELAPSPLRQPTPPPPHDADQDTLDTRGPLTREAANVWRCRVGPPDQPAPPDRVQSLFNDIELYPTKTQVFEMLICARQCARRKSLTLTFGEFCVFAAELRLHSRRARQASNKPESPQWNAEKELRNRESRTLNGSEASPPPCEVFLGGSCNPTTWRSDIAIPMLKQMGITYFNPQVEDWSLELMEVEHRAKAAARALLFVLDSETRTVAASVEVAHLAAAPRDLLLVLRPYQRHQTIGRETITDQEYVELSRARATLQEAVERRGLPAFTDIPSALRCARAVLRGARTHPRHQLGHTILRLKRAFDAAGGRSARLTRARALDALQEVTASSRDLVDRRLPPAVDTVDFETFCAAVVELAADGGSPTRNGYGGSDKTVEGSVMSGERCGAQRNNGLQPRNDTNGLYTYNARLRAYGKKLRLFIPKNGGTRDTSSGGSAPDSGGGTGGANTGSGGTGAAGTGEEGVFTPGTERRLERLPAMLGAPTHDVYLGGSFPSNCSRPEEILRREGYTYVIPRANDYSRMFSAPARRSAPAHPESPRTDKKPRATLEPTPTVPAVSPLPDEVELRQNTSRDQPTDRLSASDFYTVSEDHTPQPFKGTYDEDLLLGSRVLLFSLSAEAPCFAAMVLAAHYMGLRPHATVLIVQPMDVNSAHPYSEAAVKDYNRGRHYLTDLAHRTKVPVFDSTEGAMAYVVRRLRDGTQ